MPLQQKSILMYDDVLDQINTVKFLLRNDFIFEGVTSEREMWKSLVQKHWDILLLDLSLNEKQPGNVSIGIELIRYINEAFPALRIVIHTMDKSNSTRYDSLVEGAIKYIEKEYPQEFSLANELKSFSKDQRKPGPIKIFIGHADEDRGCKNKLIKTLTPIRKDYAISILESDKIPPGSPKNLVEDYINSADFGIILLSTEMYNSDIYEKIENTISSKHKYFIPVKVSPCIDSKTIEDLIIIPRGEKYLNQLDKGDEIYKEVATEILEYVKKTYETDKGHLHICGRCPHKNKPHHTH